MWFCPLSSLICHPCDLLRVGRSTDTVSISLEVPSGSKRSAGYLTAPPPQQQQQQRNMTTCRLGVCRVCIPTHGHMLFFCSLTLVHTNKQIKCEDVHGKVQVSKACQPRLPRTNGKTSRGHRHRSTARHSDMVVVPGTMKC